jgi:hypothetical protein
MLWSLLGGISVAADAVDFAGAVAPLLAAKCGGCHAGGAVESGFRIDIREHAMKGGDSGTVGIAAGDLAGSELWTRIVSDRDDLRMPAGGEPLTAEEREIIRAWIVAGAAWPDAIATLPASMVPVADKRAAAEIDHWAYQAVKKPAVPHRATSGPIDAFLHERLAAHGLCMGPEADPRTLIRRVTFDLIGLPPTREEIQAFERACRAAGGTDNPYRDLVDRLLATPQYGERWARHWLDVVRFAESDGFETNRLRPNAWPYRDWVIEAFNSDLPYDAFLRAQLAGDACGADAATGFLVGGPVDRVKSPDPVLTANQRADELHDMVGTTGGAFLGLTVGCARCHDHKFDPIRQTDYYRIAAVFAGVQHGERDIRPPDYEALQRQAVAVRQRLEEPQRRLAELQPVCRLGRTIVIDDLTTGSVELLVTPGGVATHAAGPGPGQLDFQGGTAALPNLGKQYHWWHAQAGQPVMAYAPQSAGRFRIWVSWGAGWNSHAMDARYLLDADGDPLTTDDQREIARIDQRLAADGGGSPPPQQSLWSGLADVGVHALTPSTRLLVAAGAKPSAVTADVVLFEEQPVEGDVQARIAHLRGPVVRGATVDRFPTVLARYVRFIVLGTSGAEPCLDELEVFSTDGRNVARTATPSASGTFADNPKHRLEHINDGRYGNDRSWISNTVGGGWVQLELAETERIERVVWSRDRGAKPQYGDRLAVRYQVAVSTDGADWTVVASSADRLPFDYVHAGGDHPVGPIVSAAELSPNELAERECLETQVAELTAALSRLTTLPKAYAGTFAKPGMMHRFFRGDPLQPREEVAPGGIAVFGGELGLSLDAPEQDRRRALAAWIASPNNPLTARVIVNRLWHHHFGTGIVDTPSDFGLNGGRPTHPELLDWLAATLVENGWSLKAIHRLMVTSHAYRQSSDARPEAMAIDAGCRMLWRYPPQRLEAEALRDAILLVSGSLNTTMGGPGFDLFEPNSNYVKVYKTKTSFTADDFRRMVYQSKPRAELDDFFGAFDCPDAGQPQPARTVSTTPLQALNMLNGAFLLDQSRRFADRVVSDVGSDSRRQVARAIELAFGRDPTPDELTAGSDLVTTHGLPLLCRSLYNANEFLFID